MPTEVYNMNQSRSYTYSPSDNVNGKYAEIDLTNVVKIRIECYGGNSVCGDGTTKSCGGYAYGELDTTNINKLYIWVGAKADGRVGGNGWGKGGNSVHVSNNMMGYGGGGASAVSTDPEDTDKVLIVAGGAGGGSDYATTTATGLTDQYGNPTYNTTFQYIRGYHGGGWSGEDPQFLEGIYTDPTKNHTGLPGTQTGPGLGGCIHNTTPNESETWYACNGFGSNGGNGRPDLDADHHGVTMGGAPGGGAGFYGGGGGCVRAGGGSSYVAGNENCPKKHPDGYKFTNSGSTVGGNQGGNDDGRVVIYILSIAQIPSQEMTSTVTVFERLKAVDVRIPYPYEPFTEMEFFCTDKYGRFVSSKYYYKREPTILRFPDNHYNLNNYEEIRFVFCHNKGKYAINKFETNTISVADQYQYDIPSPYNALLDLRMRFKVFYDRRELTIGSECYISIYEGILTLDKSLTIEDGKDIDIVCFYTGNPYSKAVSTLPMSGYIYLKKHLIDRNYNKNLMAVFVNGKLIPRQNILDISNNIHKITKDTRSRANLEIRNLSPKIHSLVPFYKKNCTKQSIPLQYKYQEFTCMIEVYEHKTPHNRFRLDDTVDPLILEGILDHPEWYISLIHHGSNDYDTRLNYTVRFFKDDYTNDPSDVNVVAQMSYPTNELEFNSLTCLLLGQIPNTMRENYEDYSLFTIGCATIMKFDIYNQQPEDGIICRLQINEPKKDKPAYVYYELTSSDYEIDQKVGVFEWVVSDQPDGKGHVFYRKTIWLLPMNNPVADDSILHDAEDDDKNAYTDIESQIVVTEYGVNP